MRTTVDLEPDVLAAIEELQQDRHLGRSEAVNELVRAGALVSGPRARFVQRTKAIGVRIDVSNVAEALEALGPAVAIREEQLRKDPNNADGKAKLAFLIATVGDAQQRVGALGDAARSYERARILSAASPNAIQSPICKNGNSPTNAAEVAAFARQQSVCPQS